MSSSDPTQSIQECRSSKSSSSKSIRSYGEQAIFWAPEVLPTVAPVSFYELPKQRRERLSTAIRALEAHAAGSTYHTIAELLFGKKRIPDRAWKTHDLRSRTIRLVQTGLALVRGGYRKLLRPGRRDV